jgi:hypothetical protein
MRPKPTQRSPMARLRVMNAPVNASDPLEVGLADPSLPEESDDPEDAVEPAAVVVVAPPDDVIVVVVGEVVVALGVVGAVVVVVVVVVVPPPVPAPAVQVNPCGSLAAAVKVT